MSDPDPKALLQKAVIDLMHLTLGAAQLLTEGANLLTESQRESYDWLSWVKRAEVWKSAATTSVNEFYESRG